MKPADLFEYLINENPFKHWRTIRRVLKQKHGIHEADLEVLIELYSVKYFTTEDFRNGTLTTNWETRRWTRLQEEGWIEMYRKRKGGSNHRYDIYKLSRKSLLMIREGFRYVSKVDKIPDKSYDPDSRKYKTCTKRYMIKKIALVNGTT